MFSYVPMELVKIILSDINDHQVIYLQEKGGTRSFPIVIGRFEAVRINSRVQGEENTRPLTHDLLKSSITQLGGKPVKILINRLEEHTYFAILQIEQNGKTIEIDCRPSDAVALAVCYNPVLPIFVDSSILDSVA